MRSRIFHAPLSLILLLTVVLLVFVTCSEDSKCPTCPTLTQWVEYDNFDDNTLNTDLWNYSVSYGGQALEADSVLQVWGHTGSWTGRGIARTIEPKLAWRFDLVETYHEDGPGCQGWHIRAIDPVDNAVVEVLNECTAGCTNPPNMGDVMGTYEIKHEQDSLAVYLDGSLLRRLHDNGIDFSVMEFRSDNVYGSGDHCHIFVDNIWGLEWKP